MTYTSLRSCLCFCAKLKTYSSSLAECLSESDSYSMSLFSSSSSFMQTESLGLGIHPLHLQITGCYIFPPLIPSKVFWQRFE